MKTILTSTFVVILSMPAMASMTSDNHETLIQNSEVTEAFSLKTLTNKTEYTTKTVSATCYKDVINGTREVCDKFSRFPSVAGLVPNRPIHAPSHKSACHEEIVYKTVAYTCDKTVAVPNEVFDHNSVANVNVKISAAPKTKTQTANCGISFNMTGDSLTAANTCADYLATFVKAEETGKNETNYTYIVKLFDAQSVLAPLAGKLQNMQVDGDDLIVQTGNLSGATNYNLKLYVERKRLFQDDYVLVNRVLDAKEFFYEPINDTTGNVHINLKKLLVGFESNRKYAIQLNLDINLGEGTILSKEKLPSLHQQANLTIY